MKQLIIALVILMLLVTAIALFSCKKRAKQPEPNQPSSTKHLYVTWDTMEFDKCVSAWLILKFIDANAQFVFVTQGTEITNGIPFDIPGAEWSRKHRKCTSQCILESIGSTDQTVEKMVEMASQVELNFWQLDRWPDTQKCFYNEVQAITDAASNPAEYFEKTRPYFDRMYNQLKASKITKGSEEKPNE